jgi:hypothetical protein
METPIATPIATTTPIAPAPTPTPAPAPMPTASTPTPMPNVVMGEGGSTDSGSNDSGSGKSFWKSLNILEIGFSILGVASLSYVIYYYQFKLKQDKLINNELQRQIDEIKMNMQTNMKGKYKTI